MTLRRRVSAACVALTLTGLVACGHHSTPALAPAPPEPAAFDESTLSEFALAPAVTTAGAKPAIFVANPDSVLEFLETSTGNVVPSKNISGPTSQVSGATGITVGPTGKIYVSTASNGILVFGPTQNGDALALQHIKGVTGVAGVGLDSAGNIYVVEAASNVKVFAPAANGMVAPIRTFSNAEINKPQSIALDALDKVYIASEGSKSVTVFAAGASGAVAPIRTIAGAATTIVSPMGISVDVHGDIFLAQRTGRILIFGPTQNGNVAPGRTIIDSQADAAFNGLGISIGGTPVVANANGKFHDEIDTFAKTASGASAPARIISGVSTDLAQPVAIGMFEQLQSAGVRLSGESSVHNSHYGTILGYFNGTTATTTSLVMLTAGDPVQFTNVDSLQPHTVSFLGDATATSAPWPSTFTGGGTTPSPAGTAINTPGFTTGQLNPGHRSNIYDSGGPGFYMVGCFFHYQSNTMRDVIVVQ